MLVRRLTPLLVATSLLAAGLVGAPAAAGAPVPVRAAAVPTGYLDTCHDADPSVLDLRRVEVLQDTTAREYSLTFETCRPFSIDYFWAGGSVETMIVPPEAASRYSAVLVADPEGPLELVVVEVPAEGGATAFQERSRTTVESPSDDFTVTGTFPYAAIGDPPRFSFDVVAQAPAQAEQEAPVDHLPEPYARDLDYPNDPNRCNQIAAQGATVVLADDAPAAAGLARAAARSASAPHRRVLSLDGITDAALAQLRRTPGVASAERPVGLTRSRLPDDPGYPLQWSLPEIGAPRAWDVRTSSGLRLAVIDDGVDGIRPELAGRVAAGLDTLHTLDGRPVLLPAGGDSDLGGHGTAVAGLAAAATDDDASVAAVDWAASIIPYRVFDASGCATDGAVVAALLDAADRGASVINLSLGGPQSSTALRDAVAEVTRRGSLVVAAAGNNAQSGNSTNYPAGYAEVLAVGATVRGGALAAYSSTGPHVDLTAPGGSGAGTPEADLLVLGERDGLAAVAGTSFAAPLVSAAALLFRAQHPSLSPVQVHDALRRTAVDAGAPGPDPGYGAGRLDLDRLLRLAVPRGTALACPPEEVPEDGFLDAEGSVHEAAIDCVVWWRIANGTGTGYSPATAVSRGQMASFLARLVERTGGSLPADPRDAFPDDAGLVHERSIDQLAALGIVGGRADGTFGPDAPVTRAQMATFLVRTYEKRTQVVLPPSFDHFRDDDGSVHQSRIDQAAAAGFTGGLSAGTYGPDALVRRDGMATFLARVLDRLVQEGHAAPPEA